MAGQYGYTGKLQLSSPPASQVGVAGMFRIGEGRLAARHPPWASQYRYSGQGANGEYQCVVASKADVSGGTSSQ